jgi:hypothetical protein
MNCRIAVLTLLALPLAFGQHPSMPPGMSHEEHMKQLADRAMGFDQAKVRHHFHLTASGGSIEVGVNAKDDAESLAQIRHHLQEIARQFAEGVFTSPIATHAETPPGVPVLRERKARIHYQYQETPEGARVTIDTKDRTARNAVHEFLKYQIREHATGDPLSVQK